MDYRAIPLGQYRTIYRSPEPGVFVRQLDNKKGPTVFYAVNTAPTDRGLIIETKGTLKELSSTTANVVPSAGEIPALGGMVKDTISYEIPLRKFELKVFQVDKGMIDGVFETRSPRRR